MSPAHILVVDDDGAFLETLADFLVERGHQVTTAHSGTAALEVLASARPDLVLLDIWMPDGGGLEVLRHIVAATPTLPVVMVTGNNDRAATAEALRLGASDYVPKPIEFGYLEQVLAVQLPTVQALDSDRVLELREVDGTCTPDFSEYPSSSCAHDA
jgi:CheY-like chemotaxis protein